MFVPISVVPLEAVMIYKMYSWPLGDFGCGIATLLSELVTYVSIVTMIMFSIERYVIENYFSLEDIKYLWISIIYQIYF